MVMKEVTTIRITATRCNTLQHTATHCNTLQRTDCNTPCNTDLEVDESDGDEGSHDDQNHCNTLQHAATRCNTLQHAATHCTWK